AAGDGLRRILPASRGRAAPPSDGPPTVGRRWFGGDYGADVHRAELERAGNWKAPATGYVLRFQSLPSHALSPGRRAPGGGTEHLPPLREGSFRHGLAVAGGS